MAQDVVVETRNLTKVYRDFWGRKKKTALNALDLKIHKGEIFGLLGPNGSGKTTTIKLLLGLLFPTAGDAFVFGEPAAKVEKNEKIGYLPEESYLYRFLNAEETLDFYGRLFDIPAETRRKRAAELIETVGLGSDKKRILKEYSKGMRQRIGLAQALINDPQLVILDEPTSGLDPLAQQTFAELAREAVARGATVFLSSHDLPEVQRLADRVGIVREGRLVLVEGVDELRARAPARIEALFAEPPPDDAFAGVAGVRVRERRDSSVVFALEGEVDPLLKALARHHVIALDSHEADLEDVFLALYGEGGPDA
jgi:ABC-2 type transport system ATP-binding protein